MTLALPFKTKVFEIRQAIRIGKFPSAEALIVESIDELDCNISSSATPEGRKAHGELFLLMATSKVSCGQHREAESWLARAEQELAHLTEHELSNELLRQRGIIDLRQGRLESALDCFQRGLQNARERKNSRDEIGLLLNIALVLREQSEYSECVEMSQSALRIAEANQDVEMQASAQFQIAIIHNILGNFTQSLELCSHAMTLHGQMENHTGTFDCLAQMAITYRQLKEYDKAEEAYLKVIALCKELGMPNRIAVNLGNLGILYAYKGDFHKSKDYLAEAIGLAKTEQSPQKIAIFLNAYAESEMELGDLQSSKKNFIETLRLRREVLKNDASASPTLICLAKVSHLLHEYDEALRFGREALEICLEKKTLPMLGLAYKTLADIYKANGDAGKSLEMFEKHHEIHEQLQLQDSRRLADRLEFQRKMAEIENGREEEKRKSDAQRVELERAQSELVKKTEELSSLAIRIIEKQEFIAMIEEGLSRIIHAVTYGILYQSTQFSWNELYTRCGMGSTKRWLAHSTLLGAQWK